MAEGRRRREGLGPRRRSERRGASSTRLPSRRSAFDASPFLLPLSVRAKFASLLACCLALVSGLGPCLRRDECARWLYADVPLLFALLRNLVIICALVLVFIHRARLPSALYSHQATSRVVARDNPPAPASSLCLISLSLQDSHLATVCSRSGFFSRTTSSPGTP